MTAAGWRAAVVMTLVFIPGGMLVTILTPALPLLGAEFAPESPSSSVVLVTAFLASMMVFALLGSVLVAAVGGRKAMIIVQCAVGCGALISVFAPDLLIATAGRVVQGASGAALPIALTLVRLGFADRERSQLYGITSGLGAFGGGAGLLFAGPLVDIAGVRAGLWVPAALGLVAVFLMGWLPEGGRIRPMHVDIPGIAACVATLALLFAAVTAVESSIPLALVLVTAAAACLAIWVWTDRRARYPLVPFAVVARSAVARMVLANAFIGVVMSLRLLTLPAHLQSSSADGGLGLTATQAGWVLVPVSVGVVIGSWTMGELMASLNRVRWLAVTGCALTAVGTSIMFVAPYEAFWLGVGSLVNGVGLGGVFAASAPLGLAGARLEETTAIMGVIGFARAAGQSLGPQTVVALLATGPVDAPLGLAESDHTVFTAIVAALGLAAALVIAWPSGPRRGRTR